MITPDLKYINHTIDFLIKMTLIHIVPRIPVTLFDGFDPRIFVTVQVKVLPNAGGLTMRTFSYVAEALLVTVCTIL